MSQLAKNIVDTGGTTRAGATHASNFNLNYSNRADGGSTTEGIVVGTGTGAVSLTDYALGTLIAHGTGAGQLDYGGIVTSTPVTVGTTRLFKASRSIWNYSGSSISITEMGLYCCFAGATYYNACIDRSLVSVTLPDGEGRVFEYEFSITV
jgi:hypothetical protein